MSRGCGTATQLVLHSTLSRWAGSDRLPLGLEVISYGTGNPEHQIVHGLIKPADSPRLLFFMALNSLSA